jgi:RNA polymerase sigma-70 factor (ECF subfamily)
MMIVCDADKTRIAPSGFAASGPTIAETRPVLVDDTLLIREAQQGNSAAFEELARHYDRAVLRLVIHLTGSQEDGQEICQEAFLRAYMNLPSFRFECSFYTWIYRIVTNLCLDHLRKKNSRGQDVTTIIFPGGEEEHVMPNHSPGASTQSSLVGREPRLCTLGALRRLSPRERVVFELKHYQGLRLRTVADILNTTEDTIKNTFFRATHKLRTQLAEVR